jgi:hypothetical protein
MTEPVLQRPQTLWKNLREAGHVSGDYPVQDAPSAWYIKLLLASSGWLAAVFLLGFFALGLEDLLRNETVALIIGMLLLVGAWLLLRAQALNVFASHLALAMSLAGQALMLWPLVEWLGEGSSRFWLALFVLQAALAWIMPDFLHRVFSAAVAAIALAMLLWTQRWYPLPVPLLLFAVSWLWLHEFAYPRQLQRIVPIAYGITLGLLLARSFWAFGMNFWIADSSGMDDTTRLPFWLGNVLLTLVIVFVVWRLLQRHGLTWTDRCWQAAMVAAVLLGVLSQEVSGISIGMTLLILGFAARNRVLMGIAVAALLYFISSYYYYLGATLLVKSAILVGVGTVCLLLRWVVLRWLQQGVADA